MKENNLNRVIGWSGLLLTSLLSTSALADNIGTSAEELGLSDYRHFVIYPRLDKALKAQTLTVGLAALGIGSLIMFFAPNFAVLCVGALIAGISYPTMISYKIGRAHV